MSFNDEVMIDEVYDKLEREAQEGGYNLNPDREFTRELIRGLLSNNERYEYPACPCRLASGSKVDDLDIICPCDYRDPDLAEFGTCYCALYLTSEIISGERKLGSIPERRPPGGPNAKIKGSPADKTQPTEPHVEEYEMVNIKGLPFPVWRCKVCGYLCARPQPPEVCPICKVSKERFEIFM
jgi:ferredoxin-thioredoxin reductase catalytic chain